MFSWLIAGVIAFLSAAVFADLASRIQRSGSSYKYAYIISGELPAWIVGWNMIARIGIPTAFNARAFSSFVVGLFAFFDVKLPEWLYSFKILGRTTSLLSALNILFCTYLCTLGTRSSGNFNNALTSTKMALLMLIMSISFAYTNWAYMETIIAPKRDLIDIVDGSTYVFIGFIGFDLLSLYSSEAKDPETVIPQSIMMAQLIVFVIYVVNSVSMVGIGMQNLDLGNDAEWAYAMSFKHLGLNWMVVVIFAASILGTIVVNLTG